jgi:hypothetical protein
MGYSNFECAFLDGLLIQKSGQLRIDIKRHRMSDGLVMAMTSRRLLFRHVHLIFVMMIFISTVLTYLFFGALQ